MNLKTLPNPVVTIKTATVAKARHIKARHDSKVFLKAYYKAMDEPTDFNYDALFVKMP